MLQFAGVSSGALMQCRRLDPFGFSPKISTPVENTVEKQEVTAEVLKKTPISGLFSRGEA